MIPPTKILCIIFHHHFLLCLFALGKQLNVSPLLSFLCPGTGRSGDVTAARRHPTAAPGQWRFVWGGAQPGLRPATRLRGQPAAGRHDEADDGHGAGEAGADAHDGAAEAAAHPGAAAAAAAAVAGRAGECDPVGACTSVHQLAGYKEAE